MVRNINSVELDIPQTLVREHGGIVDLRDGQTTPGSVVVEGVNQVPAALEMIDEKMAGAAPTKVISGPEHVALSWQDERRNSTVAGGVGGTAVGIISRVPAGK